MPVDAESQAAAVTLSKQLWGIVGRRQHRAAMDPTPVAAPFVL
jgi:hypothetical protein